jgi:hypothetical protein
MCNMDSDEIRCSMIQVVYRFIRHGTHGVAPSLPHHVSAPENCVWECKQVQTPQTNDDHRNKRRPVGCCLLLCQRNTLTPSGKPSDSKHHRSMSGAQSSWFRNFPSPSPQTFSATPVPHRSVTMALPRSNHSMYNSQLHKPHSMGPRSQKPWPTSVGSSPSSLIYVSDHIDSALDIQSATYTGSTASLIHVSGHPSRLSAGL